MSDKKILCCPLMSAGHTIEVLCSQESCAWYIKNYKMCSMHVIAHNAALEVQAKQRKK